MKRVLIIVALVAGLAFTAAPAQADATVPLPLLTSRVACVHTDFQVTGSGWKVQAAIAAWNEAQYVIRLTTTVEPGCSPIYVHLYNNAVDGLNAYTTWEHGHVDADGVWQIDGADIYLNDANDPTVSKAWSRSVIAHELGHAMGMHHSTGQRSVMSPDRVIEPGRATVARVDVWALAALYR